MDVWDAGTYEIHKFEPKEVHGDLHGDRVRGRYVLFHTRGKHWMIHRMDPPEDPERELAARGAAADDRDARHAARRRATGGRGSSSGTASARLGYVDGGRIRLVTRNGNDVTHRYPELRRPR